MAAILHVDMDAFFASVEQRDHPEYRGKPVIVGAAPDARGVVSTCSYEARKFGVHSAMPSRTAYRLCPQGIFVPPDGKRYHAASAEVFRIFERYTPYVQGLSCDEAFLDVTGSRLLFGTPVEIAQKIRADIAGELHLTASIGVAPNKFLAKVASDLNKPDGLTIVPTEPEAIRAFLAPLPVTRIFGVGKTMTALLHTHGIRTIGDLQQTHPLTLQRWVGPNSAAVLHQLAFGIDDRTVETEREEKSISRETTFLEDTTSLATVRSVLLELAADVARQVRAARRYAATAHLKWRTADFRTQTRQMPLPRVANDDFSFRDAALQLLSGLLTGQNIREEDAPLREPVRLVGFGVSHFRDTPPPAEAGLFGPDPADTQAEKREALSHAMDRIREQFGAVVRIGTDACDKS